MDLTTTYMGLTLRNPIVHSSSPLSRKIGTIRKLEDEGVAAVVMYSLFEEQIEHESHELDHYLSYGSDSYAEAQSYLPDLEAYNVGPDRYLDHIRRAKDAVEIPIIGSLNGASSGGWIDYAAKIEQAGADALELNIYNIPTDPDLRAEDIERTYVDIVTSVKQHVGIPVAVKLSPYFTNMASMARRLTKAGADALVMFNRFYQSDFDLETLTVVPHLVLSQSYEMRLPLRWTAILYGRVDTDIAITSGVHTHTDVLKAMMAGANVAMITSELLQSGVHRVAEILDSLQRWMSERDYESIAQMRGSMSQQHSAEPGAFERANYMKVLESWRPDPTGRID